MNSFLRGIASLFDFSGSLRSDHYIKDDREALESDWKAIGDDMRVALVQSRAICPEEPEYQRVVERLGELESPTQQSRQDAWDWLYEWRESLEKLHQKALPAPWVYADEAGVIEFEWEIGGMELDLFLSNPPFEYALYGNGDEEEGKVDIDGVAPLLDRFLPGQVGQPRKAKGQ